MAGKRMLHKNICTSQKLNSISDGAEALWVRLYTQSDDNGFYPYNTWKIKGDCYPIKNISIKVIQCRIDELLWAGLLEIWRSKDSGELFLKIVDFERFQILRKDIQKTEFVTNAERVRNEVVTNSLLKDKVEDKVKNKIIPYGKVDKQPSVREFLKFFGELWKEKVGKGNTYVCNFGKDGKLIKALLKIYSYEELSVLAAKFFDSEDEFIQRSGYTIGVFYSQISKLVVDRRQLTKTEKNVLKAKKMIEGGKSDK